tara:strand:- start:52 stop:240 length:189 start_codon:yes stop_codon:yes gene_type:complete
MAKYKVKALSVGGKFNKIFSVGDVVTDENFEDAKLLVEKGFLLPLSEGKKPVVKKTTKTAKK